MTDASNPAPVPFPLAADAVPGITLRSATPADIDFMVAVSLATFRDYVAAAFGATAAEQESRTRADLAVRYPFHQVITAGTDAIGNIAIEQHADHLFLDYIAIQPTHARRGLGSGLVRALQGRAQVIGLPLRLSVLEVNPAQALYRRLGFVATAVAPPRICMEWREPPRG